MTGMIDQDREIEDVRIKVRNEIRDEDGKSKTVRVTEYLCQRRKQDVRLFDAFERHHMPLERAFCRIGLGFLIATQDFRVAIARYGNEEIVGSTDPAVLLDIKNDYVHWANGLMKQRGPTDRDFMIRHSSVIDIIGFGKSCRVVDQGRGRRNGWAKATLFDALEEYCKMMRWV